MASQQPRFPQAAEFEAIPFVSELHFFRLVHQQPTRERDRLTMTQLATCSLTARDFMSPRVLTVQEQAPIKHAVKLMRDNGIRHLVVTDDYGKPVGVFSERDILRHIAKCSGGGLNSIGGIQVDQLMCKQMVTITPDTSLSDTARLLAEKKIGCVPVLDDRSRLVGIVSVIDVLRCVAGEPPEAVTEGDRRSAAN